jgi:hypothetical protein
MELSWTLGNGAFVGRCDAGRPSVRLVCKASTKVDTQDLYHILPIYHIFGNIVGGVFWRPVFNVLEEGRQIILVNAQHLKAVPGRKTDVKDSQWLAQGL